MKITILHYRETTDENGVYDLVLMNATAAEDDNVGERIRTIRKEYAEMDPATVVLQIRLEDLVD